MKGEDRLKAEIEQLHRTLEKQAAELESKNRELEIEAALERLRSRSLAMQNSSELNHVVKPLFEEIHNLGVNFHVVGISLLKNKSKDIHMWVSTADGLYDHIIHWPFVDIPVFHEIYKARISGEILDFTMNETLSKEFFKEYFKLEAVPKGRKEATKNVKVIGMIGAYQKLTGIFLLRYSEGNFSLKEKHIISRYSEVFEQTYTRFLDLQKAEAQAREAQIEAALERVRSLTMAMHTSEDVGKCIVRMFDELTALGLSKNARTGIGIFNQEDENMEVWTASRNQQDEFKIDIGILDMTLHPLLVEARKSWKSKTPFHQYILEGDDVERYFTAINSSPKYHAQVHKQHLTERVYHYDFVFNHGILFSFTDAPLPEEQLSIFQRFSTLFNQTYTRYLDLQRAEAQAREAQIEAALERVRARTMAMHKSEELGEVAAVLFDQFEALGATPERLNIGIVREEERNVEWWSTEQGGKQIDHLFKGTIDEPTTISKVFSGWKAGKKFIEIDLSGQELKEWISYLQKELGLPFDKKFQRDRRVHFACCYSHGMLLVSTPKPLPEDAKVLLQRFTNVFEQTYIRFLDLLKAEAQAREAQIEAALERVRSRSMAMQHSSELNIILAKVFEELKNLELQMERAVIWIYYPENRSVRWWAANPEAESGSESFFIADQNDPVYDEYWKAWEERRTKYLYILEGDYKENWTEILFNKTELGRLPEIVKAAMVKPEKLYLYNTFNDFGVLFISCLEPLSDEKFTILERFGKVFDQSYTRFKDIKQAEIREKEAIRQSALDRVRAEIASMRNTVDLQRITPLIWRELLTLGVPFFRCGLMIVDEKEEKVRFYLSTPDGSPLAALHLDFESNDISYNGVKHWRKQQPYIAHWNREEFLAFTKTMLAQQQIKNATTYQGGEEPPESLTLQFIPFPQGMLYVGSAEDLSPAQIDLVQNLADAFSVAYARYEDFKQLEDAKSQIEHTLTELKSTQAQLIQSEKMASLGELTAGIAHEIQNPLNFVNNFSEVSGELVDEMYEEIEKGDLEEVKFIASDLKDNLAKINLHGKRADAIVKGMLEHSRANKGEKAPTDLNALVDEFVRLSFHGLRAKDKSFNSDFKLELDPDLPKVNVVASDIGRVILNLVNNAFYAVDEKAKSSSQPTEGGEVYRPLVTVKTTVARSPSGDLRVELSVKDNGPGIPESIKDKILQPFFTTKPTGQGTGLGLSLSYDIVKAHGGELRVESSEGKGSTIIMYLPF